LGRAVVDVSAWGTGERRGLVFENRDIQVIVDQPLRVMSPKLAAGGSTCTWCRCCRPIYVLANADGKKKLQWRERNDRGG
jgi:hypothetical protein